MKKKSAVNSQSIERYLLPKVPVVNKNANVKSVLTILENIKNKYDSVDYVYVVDKREKLIGFFNVQELFNNSKNTPIMKFMKKAQVTVSLGSEIEKIAHLALKNNLKQIPVIESGKLIGVVTSREILSTINNSLRKDILHFAGIHKSHMDFENSLEIPLYKAIKSRLSWLIVGFFGTLLMALYMGLFDDTLSRYIIIATFVPAIVYISDALGTQFQTVFVRDLAILGRELNIKKYFLRQMEIAFLIASVMGILMFIFISLIWRLVNISIIISFATFITLLVTAFTSLFITLLIRKFNFDPALGSGPVATIISDMTSVVIYFIIVVLLI